MSSLIGHKLRCNDDIPLAIVGYDCQLVRGLVLVSSWWIEDLNPMLIFLLE
jgi:hypothetical protein